MTKKQFNFWGGPATQAQLDYLTERFGGLTSALRIAVDRMYREEIEMFEVVKENKPLMQAYQNIDVGKPDCWDHVSQHPTLTAAKQAAKELAKTARCQVRDADGKVLFWGSTL